MRRPAGAVPAGDQARTQAGLSSLILISAGLGSALHSALFAFVPLLGGVLSLSFALAAGLVALAAALLRCWALPAFPARLEAQTPGSATASETAAGGAVPEPAALQMVPLAVPGK